MSPREDATDELVASLVEASEMVANRSTMVGVGMLRRVAGTDNMEGDLDMGGFTYLLRGTVVTIGDKKRLALKVFPMPERGKK